MLGYLRGGFVLIALVVQVYILVDIFSQSYNFNETCTLSRDSLNPLSQSFCRMYSWYLKRLENRYWSSLEILPDSSLGLVKIKRKQILKKLHPDNTRTGDDELFQHANEFFDTAKTPHKLRVQMRNLLVIGKSIRSTYSMSESSNDNMVYDLVQQTGVKLSIGVIGFSCLNLYFLFSAYELWAKVFFMFLSLVMLIVPIVGSFVLKIMLMDLETPSDFRTDLWQNFVEILSISFTIFPNFSLQELEFVVLHFSTFWLVALAVSLPRSPKNLVKDLIETHRKVARVARGDNVNLARVFVRVEAFIKKYKESSLWQKVKKVGKFLLFILFIVSVFYSKS